MLERVPTRARVLPREPFVDVRRATDVVPRRIAVASEDVDESGANSLHVNRTGMFRASESVTDSEAPALKSSAKYADVALFKLSRGSSI